MTDATADEALLAIDEMAEEAARTKLLVAEELTLRSETA